MTGEPSPRVCIVVPCLNAEATLARCLEGLAAQTCPADEVIVADNGSRDASPRIVDDWIRARALPLRRVDVSRRGAAAARNAAVRQTEAAIIAFTDSDCVPEPDWLEQGLALLQARRDVAALAGPAAGAWEGDAAAKLLGLTTLGMETEERVVRNPGPTGMRGFPAANLWVRREAFMAVDGFDESLTTAGEDMDFCARLYASGGALLYAPCVRVRHLHASGVGGMCRKMAQYGRAHALLLERHGQPGLHVELPVWGAVHWPAPRTCWCNAVSAEKKVILVLFVSAFQPWALALIPIYIGWLARFLRRRARQVGASVGVGESLWLGVLFVVKSAALTWGRLRGSRPGAWTC